MPNRSANDPIVYIVDDQAMLDSLEALLQSVDMQTERFSSAEAFFARAEVPHGSCLLLDVRIPGMSSFELQAKLNRIGVKIPIIFISGHDDTFKSRQEHAPEVVAFLEKPCSPQALIEAVHKAIEVASADSGD